MLALTQTWTQHTEWENWQFGESIYTHAYNYVIVKTSKLIRQSIIMLSIYRDGVYARFYGLHIGGSLTRDQQCMK